LLVFGNLSRRRSDHGQKERKEGKVNNTFDGRQCKITNQVNKQ
jgi:hypothetical protein